MVRRKPEGLHTSSCDTAVWPSRNRHALAWHMRIVAQAALAAGRRAPILKKNEHHDAGLPGSVRSKASAGSVSGIAAKRRSVASIASVGSGTPNS